MNLIQLKYILIFIVAFPIGAISNFSKSPLKSDTLIENLYNIKFTRESDESEFDTLVNLNYFEENIWLFLKFNLPEITHSQTNSSTISFIDDSTVYTIKSDTAILKDRKKTFEHYENFDCLLTIDSTVFYGSDCDIPKTEISEISITFKGQNYKIPKKHYSDLFEPNIKCNSHSDCYITAYKHTNGEVIISMFNSDGAGGYCAFFIFKNQVLLKRIVGIPF